MAKEPLGKDKINKESETKQTARDKGVNSTDLLDYNVNILKALEYYAKQCKKANAGEVIIIPNVLTKKKYQHELVEISNRFIFNRNHSCRFPLILDLKIWPVEVSTEININLVSSPTKLVRKHFLKFFRFLRKSSIGK